MPADDPIYLAVRNALIKDGWIILADPYRIQYGGINLYADLSAQRPFVAERSDERIIVEIKSFIGASPVRDFENALGQYLAYRSLLRRTLPEYRLFLAVSEAVYLTFFQLTAIQEIMEDYAIALLIVQIQEEIVQWIR